MRILSLLSVLAFAACAGDLGAPVRGVVAAGDPPALRAMVGIKGASLVGRTVAPGLVRNLASGYAIIETDQGLVVGRDGSWNPAPVAHSSLTALSPNGLSAVWFNAETMAIVLSDPARNSVRIPVESAPKSIAVADDGVTILFADAAGMCWTAQAGRAAAPVPGLPPASVVRFMPGSNAALIGFDSQILVLDDVRTGAVRRSIAVPGAVADISASVSGRHIAVAFGAQVALADLETGEVLTMDPQARLRLLTAFESGFAFAASGQTGIWLWMPGSEPSFVPADLN